MVQHLRKYYNNHIDNLGRGDSFIWYGPRWAQAAAAPSRLYKAFTTEGGVRVPFLAQFPKTHPLCHPAGSISHQFSTVMDLAPTILEMAGIKHPAPSYRGREVVPMRGASMLPYVVGKTPRIHPEDHITGWETCGRAALRCGDWKLVFIPAPKGLEKWQLYNLALDPGEVHDLADAEPERRNRMLKMWERYVLETGVVPLSSALGEWVEAMERQMVEGGWMEFEYWRNGARENPGGFRREVPRFERRGGGF